MDMVGPMPYAALQSMLDGGGPKGIRGYMKAEFMPELTDEAIAELVGPRRQPSEPDHSAAARADGRRDQQGLGRRQRARPPRRALVLPRSRDVDGPGAVGGGRAPGLGRSSCRTGMSPHTTTGVYLNYTSDEGDQRVERDLRAGQVRPARRAEGPVRPVQPVPTQPEHQALSRLMSCHRTGRRGSAGPFACAVTCRA